MIEFLKRHPKGFVAFLAAEIVVLVGVAAIGISRAHYYNGSAEAACNLSAGANLTTAAGRYCKGYPSPGSRSPTTPTSGDYLHNAQKAYANGQPSNYTTYTPEYPFTGPGTQVNGRDVYYHTNPYVQPYNNGAGPGATTTAGVPRAAGHVYEYPFNGNGQQTTGTATTNGTPAPNGAAGGQAPAQAQPQTQPQPQAQPQTQTQTPITQ